MRTRVTEALVILAAMLLFAAGCGDSGTGGSDTSGGGTDGGSEAGAREAGTGGDAGPDRGLADLTVDATPDIGGDAGPQAGAWPKTCGAPAPARTVAPCGGGVSTCAVLRDEIAIADRSVGYWPRPFLILDDKDEPSVADTVDKTPRFAARGSSGWTPEPLGSGVRLQDVVGGPGAPLALTIPSAPPHAAAALWQRGASSWSQTERLATTAIRGERDSKGCLHVAMNDGKRLLYGQRDASDAWSYTVAEPATKYSTNAQQVTMALDPSGGVHFAYWRVNYGAKASWEVAWTSAAGSRGLPLGSGSLSNQAIGFAVDGAQSPHILYTRKKNVISSEIVYVSGAKLDKVVVVAPNKTGAECKQPSYDGQTCQRDYTVARVEDVVVAGGAVRLLYSTRRYVASLTAKCTSSSRGNGTGLRPAAAADGGGAPPRDVGPSCSWDGKETVTSSLVIAWPSGGGLAKATLLAGSYPTQGGRARVRVDSKGRMHLALYDYDKTSVNRADVRYILVGVK